MEEYKEFYRRKLPHLYHVGSALFITFRLANSVPKALLQKYKREKIQIDDQIARSRIVVEGELMDTRADEWREFQRRWFARFEDALHKESIGPLWLKNEKIAALVYEAFLHRRHKDFNLYALCVMSNHVHAVFRPRLTPEEILRNEQDRTYQTDGPTLGRIMKSLKGYTARQANQELKRTGQFWEVESYDHQIRNDAELHRVIRYVLNNPVKAGLVQDWREWPWTYLSKEFEGLFWPRSTDVAVCRTTKQCLPG